MQILLAILAILLIPFTEGVFRTVGLGSIIVIFALQWIQHSRNDNFRFILLLIAGLIYDAGSGIFFGTSVMVILIAVGGYLIFERLLPMQNDLIKYLGIFILMLILFAYLFLMLNGLHNLEFFSAFTFGKLFRVAFFTTFIYIFIDFITSYFAVSSSNRIKI